MMMGPAGAGTLDYFPCRYGTTRAVFRGPQRDLTRPYIAMLGGSPTFGKYVASPFPALVETTLGHPVANLGGLNAGPDFYLRDPAALSIAARAEVAVVQVTGAEALSSPLHTVHSRRNDRVLAVTPALRSLFPEVDFTDIHFSRHLLLVLERTDPAGFTIVVRTLKANWLNRMRALLDQLPSRTLVLWLANGAPPACADSMDAPGPLFIDRDMLAALGRTVVLAVPSRDALAEDAACLPVPETEAACARCLPGQAVHAEVAECLAPAIRLMLSNGEGVTLR